MDDIHRKFRLRPQKANAQDTEDVEEAEDGTSPDETLEQFQGRINLYVQIHLSRASTSKRDHYKDTLVYQARKDLISDFLKAVLLSECRNDDCNALVLYD